MALSEYHMIHSTFDHMPKDINIKHTDKCIRYKVNETQSEFWYNLFYNQKSMCNIKCSVSSKSDLVSFLILNINNVTHFTMFGH